MSVTQQGVPVWMTAMLSVAAICLTLFADRIALASTTAALSVRVSVLETASHESHQEILDRLSELSSKVEANGAVLQQVRDRQDEVRRVVGIAK